MKTRDMDMERYPNAPLWLWCDADFCGDWDKETAHLDKAIAKPRTGFIFMYA